MPTQMSKQTRTDQMTNMTIHEPLFSLITQFTINRHKPWNERGIQFDPKGLSNVINGGGLRPSGIKRPHNQIIKPCLTDHEHRSG